MLCYYFIDGIAFHKIVSVSLFYCTAPIYFFFLISTDVLFPIVFLRTHNQWFCVVVFPEQFLAVDLPTLFLGLLVDGVQSTKF